MKRIFILYVIKQRKRTIEERRTFVLKRGHVKTTKLEAQFFLSYLKSKFGAAIVQ